VPVESGVEQARLGHRSAKESAMRAMTLLAWTSLLLLSGECLAHSLGSSPWKELSFKNVGGDEVQITIDNTRNVIEKVTIKSDKCEGGFSDVSVPGAIELSGVEFLDDQDDVGKVHVLTIPYLPVSESEGTLALTIRNCRLVTKEIY